MTLDRKWGVPVLVALGYVVAGLSSLLFAHGADSIALFRPGNGFLVSVYALAGRRWRGPLLALAFAGAFLTNLAGGQEPFPSILFAGASGVEIALAAFLVGGIPGKAAFLAEEQGVVRFFLRVTLLSCACAALIGGAAEAIFLGGSFGFRISNWFLIDTAGMAVTTPMVLAWANPEFAWKRGGRRNLEFAACTVLSAVYAIASFDRGSWLWLALGKPMPYGIFLFLIWGILRFGSRGGATILFLNYAIGAWFTSRGQGLFAEAIVGNRIFLPLYLFPYAAAFCSLLPAAMSLGQRKIRDELIRRDSRYRDLVSSDLVGIFVSDMDGNILEANETFLRMIGRTRRELETEGVHTADMAPPDYLSGAAGRRENFRETGRLGPFEREWILRDGSRLHTLFFATRMQGCENALCMVVDTGELKQARIELRTVEARFKKLFDSNLIAVAVVGDSGTVIEANKNFLGMLGYSQSDLATGAINLEKIAPVVPRSGPEGTMPDAEAQIDPHETRYFRKDGCGIPVYQVVTGLNGGKGSMVIAIDLSELKRTQRELAEATRKAQSASEAKSEFLTHMSHEIRTPLNGILGMLELLAGTGLDERQRNYVRMCNESGEHLLRLINHVLDFSKIESGALEPENMNFSLPALMDRALDSLSERARKKGLAWIRTLDPELDRVFFGDPVRIQQILLNLAGNAVKFTDKGAIRVRAYALGKSPSGIRARFEVEDTGPGISREVAATLFQPFRQGDASLASKAGGTGLGLAISKGLVERLGGSIALESEVGKGSTFRFEIPLAFAPEAPIRDDHGSRQVESVACNWARPPRVLVVDDNPVSLAVAKAFLQKLGSEVDTAGDGQGALQAAARKPFDLILMDCQMPDMDGFEATRRLRTSAGPNQEVPILALTAHVGKGIRKKCLAAGMNDSVSKPFSMMGLSKALGDWFGQEVRPLAATGPEAETQHGDRPGPVDWGRLAGLKEGGLAEEGLTEKLIGLFLEMAEDGLGIIRRECQAGRKPELAMEFHKLRGACGMIGARSMQALLAEMEAKVDLDALGEIPGLLERLEAEFARTRAALESRVGPAPSAASPGREGKA